MGRHGSGTGEAARRAIVEQSWRNGTVRQLIFAPVWSSIDRLTAELIVATSLFRRSRWTIASAIESQRTSTGISSSSSCVLLLLLLHSSSLFMISAWDFFCRGWTTDSSPPRFVRPLPSSSVALPPLWPRLHDYALAFLGPGIVLLVGRVYQWVIPLVLFHIFPHPAKKKNKRVSCAPVSRNTEITT